MRGSRGGVFFDECLSFLLRLGAESFEGPALKMADKPGRLLTVQLRRIKLAEVENLGDGVEGGVDEDADEGNVRRTLCHLPPATCNYFSDRFQPNIPRARLVKDEPQQIRPGFDSHQRIFQISNSTDFNLGHDPSLNIYSNKN